MERNIYTDTEVHRMIDEEDDEKSSDDSGGKGGSGSGQVG